MKIFSKTDEFESEYVMYDLAKSKRYYLYVSSLFWQDNRPVVSLIARVSDYPFKDYPLDPIAHGGSLTTFYLKKDLLDLTQSEIKNLVKKFPKILRDRAFGYVVPLLYDVYPRLKSDRLKILVSKFDEKMSELKFTRDLTEGD